MDLFTTSQLTGLPQSGFTDTEDIKIDEKDIRLTLMAVRCPARREAKSSFSKSYFNLNPSSALTGKQMVTLEEKIQI